MLNENISVYISAAGKGSRMGTLTKVIPKPLLDIEGQPLISYLCNYLINLSEFENIVISYGYLENKWKSFVNEYENSVKFLYLNNSPNIINSFFKAFPLLKSKYILVISGDIIFDFSIIEEVIDYHIKNKCDITVALNNNVTNCWKHWEYVINKNNIVDIKRKEELTHTERFFFIINSDVVVDFTNNLTTNLGEADLEFTKYELYNRGWACLLKRLIDKKSYKIHAKFSKSNIFNINNIDNLNSAVEYIHNNKIHNVKH